MLVSLELNIFTEAHTPDCTTDTAACLRAIEINADVMLKATKVDGLFSEASNINPKADFIIHFLLKKNIKKSESHGYYQRRPSKR